MAQTYKCTAGYGVAFCGCQRNIHAVTGVTSGFRLVLLVWARPPGVRVPESLEKVCYFRPGTGQACWLHTADLRKHLARRHPFGRVWVPKRQDTCGCPECTDERKKVCWKEPLAVKSAHLAWPKLDDGLNSQAAAKCLL